MYIAGNLEKGWPMDDGNHDSCACINNMLNNLELKCLENRRNAWLTLRHCTVMWAFAEKTSILPSVTHEHELLTV